MSAQSAVLYNKSAVFYQLQFCDLKNNKYSVVSHLTVDFTSGNFMLLCPAKQLSILIILTHDIKSNVSSIRFPDINCTLVFSIYDSLKLLVLNLLFLFHYCNRKYNYEKNAISILISFSNSSAYFLFSLSNQLPSK